MCELIFVFAEGIYASVNGGTECVALGCMGKGVRGADVEWGVNVKDLEGRWHT